MEMKNRINPGRHFDSGNMALAEGAICSGLKGYYGYPITPSTTIMEHIVKRFRALEDPGYFLQCEDEIASVTALIGCSWTRNKAMTATSGPGFSLMQEGIGLAVITETPLVIANVMRGGPSTGLPTFPAQQELMQAHFGSHGDYIIPTFAPWSVQECFDMAVEAFNTSEALRTPSIILSDQAISTLKEKFVIPEELEVIDRASVDHSVVWKGEEISTELVQPMNCFGEEKKAFSTGLAHDDTGHVDLSADNYEKMMKRLFKKITSHSHLFPEIKQYQTEDADLIIISYGFTARSSLQAVETLRNQGMKVGLCRLTTLWPFPADELKEITNGKEILVVEASKGQLIWPVERYLLKKAHHLAYLRGSIPPPNVISLKAKKILK